MWILYRKHNKYCFNHKTSIILSIVFHVFTTRWVVRVFVLGNNPSQNRFRGCDFSFFSRPPYSPDLAPSDFHPLPKLKEYLRGQHFGSDEVKSAVRECLREQNSKFYKNGFKKLVFRWRK